MFFRQEEVGHNIGGNVKCVYVTGPLFSEGEKEFNLKLAKRIENLGFKVVLPQRNGPIFEELTKRMSKEKAAEKVFEWDVKALDKSDIVVYIMDGRVPDEGAAIEIGMAFKGGKTCIGLKTTNISFIEDEDNSMIDGCLTEKHRSVDDLLNGLKKYL